MSACALESYHAPPCYTACNPREMRLAEDSALNACLKRKRIGCPLPESGPVSMKLRLSWLRSQKLAFTDVNQFTSTPHV
jgi:hypothetical protein